ncbi:MAG: Mrp/NBP35 family ATP-binding protein [Micrococcales bacterium]|nr:Mrp/NBP35 family ATP-binding protein [Micrococcales bacterium]
MTTVVRDAVMAALGEVYDPELRLPITELGMVGDVVIGEAGDVIVHLLLTVAACPLRDVLQEMAREAVAGVAGVTSAEVVLGTMTDEQRAELSGKLRGGMTEAEIPFNLPGSPTRVFAVASGKGGVGKSTITANLAVALAAAGLEVGVVDADVYGFSIPRILGCDGEPMQVGEMIVPPVACGLKVISMGMLVSTGQPVVWRGPMLHKVLRQFLADVWWGDLDVLFLDLPPGTGDIPLSVAQLLPGAEILLVTTPQIAAAEVAERAGAMALKTQQRVAGVIENMSWLEQADGSRLEVFGAGGGAAVAANLSEVLGVEVPLLGQVPLDIAVREGGDSGQPVVLDASSSVGGVLREIASVVEGRIREK